MGKAARKLSGASLAEFNKKHPRGVGGRFVKGGDGGPPSAPGVPAAPAPGRARARLGLASGVDMSLSIKALSDKRDAPVSGDREAVDEVLKPMTHAQLDEVAREFGMDSFVRGTKEEKSRQLREGIVGSKLDHDAIMRVDMSTRNIFEGAQALDLRKPSTSLAPKDPALTTAAVSSDGGRARAALGRPAPTPLDSRYHADLERQIMDLANDSDGASRAEALLSGLSVPALKEFTATLPPTVSRKGKTKAQLVRNIVEGTIGFRQRAEAIGPGVAATRTAERLAEAAPSSATPAAQPKASRARAKLSPKPKARPEGERAKDLIAISGGVNPWAGRQQPTAQPSSNAGGLAAASRRVSSNPRKRNTWGGAPTADGVHYHPDGLMGETTDKLGTDASLEVRGDSLVNVLDRIATDTVLRRTTAQQQADSLARLADELPDGPGKRAVQGAAQALDKPRINIDQWAKGVEPVLARFPALRQLAQRLEAVPLARGANIPGDRADMRELDGLHTALDEFGRGRLGGGRFIAAIEALDNKRHESREGKMEIDRVVQAAVEQLREMQRADRTVFYPPGKA